MDSFKDSRIIGRGYNQCENLYDPTAHAEIIAISSAAGALEIISSLLNLKKNDEVIIPAQTYCASAIPFARQGAKIIWADINFNTRVVDLEDIKKKITSKTKAIVIVHLYGYACDFRKIIGFCKKKKIKIIEDCAQSLGA